MAFVRFINSLLTIICFHQLIVSEGWKSATITPLLKEGKDPNDVRSYRPVAQANIFCKIFKRMTKMRLVWYLEKEKKINDR